MIDLFLELINRSISVSWLILVVFAFRFLLKKAPKRVMVLFWGLVAIRLICPFSIESILSLIPSAETISPEIMTETKPAIESGISFINASVNPIIGEMFAPTPVASANPLQIWIPVFAIIWCVGLAGMLSYAVIGWVRLNRKVKTAVRFRENIYQSEYIPTPFVLGILKPRIYLPFSLTGQEQEYVIDHEQTHIRRKDHWWKLFGFLVLSLYWFHPLLWIAYILFCRDIELACDETVIRKLDREQRADYSQTLLACSSNRNLRFACPLAFSEVGVMERVKHVLNYKKPSFWVILLSIASCMVIAVCFLTNPKQDKVQGNPMSSTKVALEALPADYTPEQAKKDGCVVIENGDVSFGQDIWEEFYKKTQKGKPATVRYVHYYSLREPEHYDPDYYESVKNDYPKMYVYDLTYDGEVYREHHFEGTEEIVNEFLYLMHYVWKPDSPKALFDSQILYVLTDDDTVTWDEIMSGMLSSWAPNNIPRFESVYSDYLYIDESVR